jgi:DMSO reductase anchor subunit
MRPAFSVVAFTVLSGAGLGALALIALIELAQLASLVAPVPAPVLGLTAACALGLVVAGLLCSTLHLGNPRNAWRSLSRWRTSWLSREALAALALLPVAALMVLMLLRDAPAAATAAIALAAVALAWTTIYCTAMIYASLKPIRHWHTRHVPAAYLALGHAAGAVLVVGLLGAQGEVRGAFIVVAVALLLAAAFVKFDYYAYVAGDGKRLTLEDAIGVAQGVAPALRRPPVPGSVMRARLLDAGHSRGTFLTHEFGYTLAPAARTALRMAFWLGGIVLPAVWLVAGVRDASGAAVALAACLLGHGAERWLFFAEARHTVRLYHGDATT